MQLVGRNKLDEFIKTHADTRAWIENWVTDIETARWRTSQDIKSRYASASFLADRTVIFNVKGNRYRLEVQVAYHTGVVVVGWIGTHAEYTKRVR
ncbi:MAG TPA: type II toxin-antitoxin system HigB family toxin [Candidatus Acidoferrales bacterium]|nr:type II toxin-antitoxin system HigB family toxin [Candidatus Acidoferrales bacterium]